MKYSQEALKEMAEKIDLRELASQKVDFVKHSGETEFAVCCFHDEKTASLAITPEIFHCFGCGKFGSVYTWLQLTENLTFEQAVQKVAEITNTDVHDYMESESMNFFKQLRKINLPKKRDTAERQILDIEKDYRQKFKDELPQEWLDEGISAEEMRKYEIRTDPMSNRIVYPVYDADYNLIGVKGRTRFVNYKQLKIMKYMNYHKLGGRLDFLTGMKQAEKYIRQRNEVIIFEGLKSVMKADSWGYHNCVSAETSALNEYQIELLIKMRVRNVVIAFDKDVAMRKILNSVELLKKFTNVWVVYDKWKLLGEKDSPPDRGREVWATLYERKMRI